MTSLKKQTTHKYIHNIVYRNATAISIKNIKNYLKLPEISKPDRKPGELLHPDKNRNIIESNYAEAIFDENGGLRMATALETIQTLVRSLDKSTESNGVKALDTAIRACSTYSSTQALINDFVAKCTTMKGKSSSEINNFLKETCGIDLYNDDTGAITGYDAGSSATQKDKESIVPEPAVTPGQIIYFNCNDTYNFGNSSDHTKITVKLPNYSNESEKSMLAGLYNYWIEGSVRLVYESYNLYFNKGQDSTDSKLDYMYIDFENKSNNTLATTKYSWYDGSSTICKLGIVINMNNYPNFSWGNGKNASGYSPSASWFFDRTFAHEMTHAMMFMDVSTGINKTLPQFFQEGLAELTHGIDDARRTTILNLVSGKSSLKNALDVEVTGTGTIDCYAAGYLLLRYLAHQMKIGNAAPTPVTPTPAEPESDFIYSENNTVLKISASYKENNIHEFKDSVRTVDATKVNHYVSIWGNSKDNLLKAGNMGSRLWGGYGNDTLVGGSGSDVFRFYGDEGHDVIQNYQPGKDSISIGGTYYGALKSAQVSGSDVILYVGNGTLTVKNGKGKKIKVTDGNSKVSTTAFSSGSYTYDDSTGKFISDAVLAAAAKMPKGLSYSADYTGLNAAATYKGKYIYASAYSEHIRTINASAMTTRITINGNKNDNILVAGKNGSYLWGAMGNDTLYGGIGADTFRFYGDEGNDVVVNYQGEKDEISLGSDYYGKLKSATVSGNDVVLSVGDGTLTVKNGKGAPIRIVDANNVASLTVFTTGTSDYDSTTGTFTGDATRNLFATTPRGIAYNAKRTALTATAAFAGIEIDAKKYWPTIQTINASAVRRGVRVRGTDDVKSITGSRYSDVLYAGNGNSTLNGGSGHDLLYGGSYADSLIGGVGIDTLYGGAGNDTLAGGAAADLLDGGAGSDMLYGGAGNDMLYGGAGADVFVHTNGDGHDTIADYAAEDTVQILKGTVAKATLENESADVKLAVGKGSVTLKDTGSTNITVKDTSGSYVLGGNWINLGADYAGTMDARKFHWSISTVDGSDAAKAVNLYGSDRANVLRAGQAGGALRGYAGNDTLYGGAGADVFWHDSGDDVIYNYTGGKDKIRSASALLNFADSVGNDVVLNFTNGEKVTVKDVTGQTITYLNARGTASTFVAGGTGNDTVIGANKSEMLLGGDGMDILFGGKGNDTLVGGADSDGFMYASGDGADTIADYTQDVDILYITSGDVSAAKIAKNKKDVVLTVGKGSITLKNTANAKIDISTSHGGYLLSQDSISLWNNFTGTLDANKLLSTIEQIDGSGVTQGIALRSRSNLATTVKGGSGNDTITGSNKNDFLQGNGGADSLTGGAGRDTLYGGTGSDTLYGGAGDDYLSGGTGSDVFMYTNGEGNDTIADFTAEDTVQILRATVTKATLENGNADVKLTVGKGSLTLKNTGNTDIAVKDTSGSYILGVNSISLRDDYRGTMDVRKFQWDVTTVDGSAAAKAVNLYGNDRANVLRAGQAGGSLRGFAGNDTMYGGTGKDVFWYDSGNNAVYDYEAGKDSIRTAKSALKSCEIYGNDIVMKFADYGSMTLKNAAGKTVTYIDAAGRAQKKTPTVTQQSVIRAFMHALDGTATNNIGTLLNTAVNYASNGKYASWNALVSEFTTRAKQMIQPDGAVIQAWNGRNMEYISGSSHAFLKEYCGIDLTNKDTGAITGKDAGGSKTEKTAASIVAESGALRKLTAKDYANGTNINGLTFHWATPQDTAQQSILNRIYTWWAKNGLTLNEASYGLTFNEEGTTVRDIYVVFESNPYSGATMSVDTSYNNYETDSLQLRINMYYLGTIKATDQDGHVEGEGNVDRILAHELTHALMAANVFDYAHLPLYVKEGLADLTHGGDEFRWDRLKELAESPDGLKTILDDTYHYATDEEKPTYYRDYYYAAGYMLFRYLAKQVADAGQSGSYYASPTSVSISSSASASASASTGKSLGASASASVSANTPVPASIAAVATDSASPMWFESGSMAPKTIGDTQLSDLQNLGVLGTTDVSVSSGTSLGLAALSTGTEAALGLVPAAGSTTQSVIAPATGNSDNKKKLA